MEAVPFLILAGVILLILLVTLLPLPNRTRSVLLYLLSLTNLLNAVWIFLRTLNTEAVLLSEKFLEIQSGIQLRLEMKADSATGFVWLVFSLIFSTMLTFHRTDRKFRPLGVAPSLSLLAMALLLFFDGVSGVFFGWTLLCFVSYCEILWNAAIEKKYENQSIRYLIPAILSDLATLVGLLGVAGYSSSASFADIGKVLTSFSSGENFNGWVVLILVGVLSRLYQFPNLFTARYLSSLGSSMRTLFYSATLFAGMRIMGFLFSPINPSRYAEVLSLAPVLTGFVSAIALVSLPKNADKTLWLFPYVLSNVAICALVGAPEVLILVATTGALALTLIEVAGTFYERRHRYGAKLVAFSVLCFTAVPLLNSGWVRYMEYRSYLVEASPLPYLHWFCFSMKVVTDIIIGFGMVSIFREYWEEETNKEAHPILEKGFQLDLYFFTGLIFLLNTAIGLGGRIFAGWAGLELETLAPNFHWFERWIIPFWASSIGRSVAIEAPSDLDYIARGIGLVVLIFSIVLSFWLMADEEKTLGVRKKFQGFVEKIQSFGVERFFWEIAIKRVGVGISLKTRSFEIAIFENAQRRSAERVLSIWRWLEGVFESRFFDQGLVYCLETITHFFAQAIRVLQNGQVQRYFSIGLALLFILFFRYLKF